MYYADIYLFPVWNVYNCPNGIPVSIADLKKFQVPIVHSATVKHIYNYYICILTHVNILVILPPTTYQVYTWEECIYKTNCIDTPF